MALSRARAEEMLHEAQDLYEDAVSAMSWRRQDLNERMAFYKGWQWGTTSPLGHVTTPFDLDEAREVLNYVRPTVRTAVADVLRNLPNPEAISTSDDPMAIARAKASQRLLRSFVRPGADAVVPYEQIVRCEVAAAIHGAAWLKVVWDPNRGPFQNTPKTDPKTGEPDVDDFGIQRFEYRREGDIRVKFVDIMSALADPHAKCSEDVRYVCHQSLLPVGLLQDQFKEDIFGQSTEDRFTVYQTQHQGWYDRETLENDGRGYDHLGTQRGSSRAKSNELAELVEFWEKPTNEYPGGRLLVFSGDVIIALGPLPYEWPWVLRLGQNIAPSGLYPDGLVADILPLQRTINLNASKRREWMDKILSPPLLNDNMSGIDRALFSDMAGEIIDYNAGHRPEWMNVPDVPQSMFTMEDQLVSVLQTISTYSDISRGEPPKGYDSGRALAYLYEFQQGVHEPDIHLFRQAIGMVLQACLKLARDFYEDGRMIRLFGENNRWMNTIFKRDDYDLDADVAVEGFSSRPNSRALRFAEVTELFNLGAMDDRPESKRARQILEMDYEDRSTTDWNEAHRNRALAEETALIADPMAEIHALPQDDHAIHLESHNYFRVTQRYFDLSPEGQAMIDDHAGEHEMLMTEQLEAMAYEQSLATGGGGAGPDGGAPPPKPNGMRSPPDGGHGAYPNPPDAAENQPAMPEMEEAA